MVSSVWIFLLRLCFGIVELFLVHVLGRDYWAIVDGRVCIWPPLQVSFATLFEPFVNIFDRGLEDVRLMLLYDFCLLQCTQDVLRLNREGVSGAHVLKDLLHISFVRS